MYCHITSTTKSLVTLIMIGTMALLQSCNGEPEGTTESSTVPSGTLITTAELTLQDVPVVLESVGRVESKTSPTIDAEVEGRILQLALHVGDAVEAGGILLELDKTELKLERQAAEAEIESVKAQIANEQRRVKRFQRLKKRDLLATTQLDDAKAALAVFLARLHAAQARLDIASDKLSKATVRAPVNARIEKRYVSVGDFVKRGDPLFIITSTDALRAYLPFPETAAEQIQPGLPVSLTSPVAKNSKVDGIITELRPMVGRGSRAVWAIVDMTNPGSWRPEATVVAHVLVDTKENAITVPNESVVRRPVGSVVYVIRDNRAEQRVVTLGRRIENQVEIVSGLIGSEIIALEGAQYLTDGAPVRIAEKLK